MDGDGLGDFVVTASNEKEGELMDAGHAYFFRSGSTVATEPTPGTPGSLAVAPAQPNPTSAAAEIRLTLPRSMDVTAEAFDLLGRRVAVLHDGPMVAGEHGLRWEAGGLPAGVYVVRVRAGDGHVATQRVTLVR